MFRILRGVLVLYLLVERGFSKYMEGELKTGENWAFLARFCFLSLEGKFEYDIEYAEEYEVQNLDLYYDTDTQWPLVYGSSSNLTSCQEKEAVLQVENNQFINLTTEVVYSGCLRHSVARDNTSYYRCKGSRNFRTARERWWFVAISNCRSAKGLNLRYKLWLTNGDRGDFFHHHFSADEFYILPILLGYGGSNLILLLFTFRTAVQLRSRQLLHVTYKLFFSSVLLQGFGIFLLSLSYLSYGMNGHGLPFMKTMGRILESTSEIMFMLLIILLAKGYTVTRARLRQWASIKVTVFICAYILCYKAVFVAEQLYFDPGSVLYLYESVWGYILVILRIIGWIMFIYSTFFTIKHYPEKGGFYYPFFCFYTLWFVSGPIIIVLGNMYIPKWVREKVVCGVEHGICLLGHTVFLILTRPSAHNKNFPYHVRTTQIGIMEALSANTTVGNHTLDGFGHHGYAVTNPNIRSYDVFTVGPSAQNWSQPAPSRPLPRVPASTPAAEEIAVKESPPPPYSTAVYDPNATDELQEWEERNI